MSDTLPEQRDPRSEQIPVAIGIRTLGPQRGRPFEFGRPIVVLQVGEKLAADEVQECSLRIACAPFRGG